MLDAALALAIRTGGAAAQALTTDLQRKASATMSMLAKLPRDMAQNVADLYRGAQGRPMTKGETAAVQEAFGVAKFDFGTVRIVSGPGFSAFAQAAFKKGNPAITLGRTIYLKRGRSDISYADLSTTEVGLDLVVHECTHVVQYATLGYAVFGMKYTADLASVGGNPDKLYDYQSRSKSFAFETIEGQAQMVGNLGVSRRLSDPLSRARAAMVKRKLQGTGIYGN